MVDTNQGFAIAIPLVWLIGMLAIAIPIFIGGAAISIKIVQVLFFTPLGGGIPVWAIFAVGIMLIYLFRRRI